MKLEVRGIKRTKESDLRDSYFYDSKSKYL